MKNELLQDLENRFETLKHIRNLAQSYDEKLFCYLLEQSTYKTEFKNRFFIVRNNTYIFKLNDFLTFLDLRNLSGSFTSYTNKIGLGFKTKSFLKTNNEVVLNFAFKDGVIKGGQSKDEDKKNEIFFNEILAKDEIDVLFARKALQNFELIGQGDLKENLNNANLLIKGNNLLALHSLKKKFANKVKLIYIDPPYNTGNDSFNYNDNFNHSTWLTFMKNRLEIAREFLRDDGVIFIQCDDNEQAYLKVLCDEIFGRENFVSTLHIELSTTQGMKVGAAQKGKIVKNGEYILIYAKNINQTYFTNILYESKEWDNHYSVYISPESIKNGKPKRDTLINFLKNKYPNITQKKIAELYSSDTDFRKYIHDNAENIFQDSNCFINFDFTDEEKKRLNNKEIIFYKKYMIFQTSNGTIKQEVSLAKAIGDTDDFDAKFGLRKIRGDWWGGFYKDMMNINKEADLVWKAGKKPERLIKDILKLTTQENDLIMDFFAGSGTTLAVAMKMKRRFIGIEQMDYIESITKERLKKVVSGEQGGISKAVDWQGGGSFIYAELMPLNVAYKERIKNINDEKELEKLYNDLESKAFLDYRIDLAEILKDKEFKDLDLQNKQEALLKILDSNMDYVLYGDIEDEDYAISSEVIELNKIFYGDCHDFANAKSRNDKKGK
ncbi:site-specific DNA-methyltransferase [Campylobacter upsaliensis]|nr:site-specific DNA-methyltransferase [Campylobacter upsaliensis]